jgi:hypothetical protein
MTSLTERFPDLADRGDPELMRVITDLDDACSSLTLPPERDAAILRAMTSHAAQAAGQPTRSRLAGLRPRWPARLTAAVTAAAVILTAGGVYLHGQGAATASAQTILRHAAVAGISASRAAHSTYRLTTSRGDRGTADVWIEADASGTPVGFALTQTLARAGALHPQLSSRRLQIGATVQTYNPATNTVQTTPADSSSRQLASMFAGPLIAYHLSALASQHGVRVLPRTTLGGAKVDALQVGVGHDATTFYYDAESYVLRGIDWTSNRVAWRARLVRSATVPLKDVPATAFTLNAPTNAHVDEQATAGADDFLGWMADACHSTPQAILDDMRAHLDSTGLDICRDTNPGITGDELAGALAAAPRAYFARELAAGEITQQEAEQNSANADTKMRYFVTTPVRNLRILNQ